MSVKLSLITAAAIDLYNRNQPVLSRRMNNIETVRAIKENEIKQRNKLKLRNGY